ncbi:MAG: hypothetical protein E3J21_26335 [Anaerolineales bacterium]|nr:MAG: hypothetical protein E3J21_26335 [Anaerolineales bacterium]
MTTANDLLITLLLDLVERVPDLPKRVLFKGVSNLYESFKQRAAAEHPNWDIRVTQKGADVVGARNDPKIAVLVVFYQAEVRERESLNAFRLFNEDEIAKELAARLAPDTLLPGLSEPYNNNERECLASLLDVVYPSVERLAEFLLAGKAHVGESLPLLGLFRDSNLRLDMPIRQWNAQLRENQQAAVLRWRDFLRKGTGTKSGRRTLGDERVALLRQAETDPAKREDVLTKVTLNEALSVLNPPTRPVERMMAAGFTRKQADDLVRAVKSGKAGYAGELNLEPLLVGLPPLPDRVRRELEALAKGKPPTNRVGFCLEGLLRLAGQEHISFPRRLEIRRTDVEGDHCAVLEIGSDGRLHVTMDSESARFLSVPSASGPSELQYEVHLKDDTPFRFTLGVMPRWLEPYDEDWLSEEYWERAEALNTDHADKWRALRERVMALHGTVDPDWKKLSEEEERGDASQKESSEEKEPNNPIYAIFDLLYFAHRELFDAFLDEWLTVAMLPWCDDAKLGQKPQEWWEAVNGLLRLGTAQGSNGEMVVFPFYPLRLAWYREVFRQIEGWLARAAQSGRSLVFEPSVMAQQLKPVDRPRVLLEGKRRLVETSADHFFIARFVPEDQHQRTRPPLYRARQKLDQFGRMWPFSLDRLHLAFQPGDAGEDIHRLLEQEPDDQPDTAYRVRAMVESTGMMTFFDRQLLSTSEDTNDLLTQEHHESILPRVDYAKGQLEHDRDEEAKSQTIAAHIVLLVDAFSEAGFNFGMVTSRIKISDWHRFRKLARSGTSDDRMTLAQVDISALPYHTESAQDNKRKLIYVPLSGNQPEYLRMLYNSLTAWQYHGEFQEGIYFEQVHWDAERLQRLHENADWVVLFDRTLDKSLFETLTSADVKLIDYYSNLPGGYKMSVSSRRTDAVEWQLAQVLQQFFSSEGLDVRQVAAEMLDALSKFASGLLLKTLGGGSLAQEMLGLYATYLSLIEEGEFVPNRDWLIPLDNYQGWFGRRTRGRRRADLMVFRNPSPGVLRLVAVESKWRKSNVGEPFVKDEFGEGGQMRTTVTSLRDLFDPTQDRLDKHYWQKTLASLLDAAPFWDSFREQLGTGQWSLEVDGLVYVHQYQEQDADRLRARNEELLADVVAHLNFPADKHFFCMGPDARRLRLKTRDEIIHLFAQAGNV